MGSGVGSDMEEGENISSATTPLGATVLPYKKTYFIRVKKLYEKL
jgi:hypothetical protein